MTHQTRIRRRAVVCIFASRAPERLLLTSTPSAETQTVSTTGVRIFLAKYLDTVGLPHNARGIVTQPEYSVTNTRSHAITTLSPQHLSLDPVSRLVGWYAKIKSPNPEPPRGILSPLQTAHRRP
jgi:hypothetical protein